MKALSGDGHRKLGSVCGECRCRSARGRTLRHLLPVVGFFFQFALLVGGVPSTASGWQAAQLPTMATVERPPWV